MRSTTRAYRFPKPNNKSPQADTITAGLTI
jgi:hypothetical protein